MAAVEREFSEYRAAQRNTPEADLVRQLADANEQVRRAEGKAEKAVAAKQGYKEQVCPRLSVCLSDCLLQLDTCNVISAPLFALVHILDVHLLYHKHDSL